MTVTEQLASRLSDIKPSPTMAISAKAAEMKAEGIPIIGLAAGEPDFDTPDFVKEATYKAIAEGQTKYTAVDGTPAIKAAISEKFLRENDLSYDAKTEITVGTGGKQVLYNAFMATLNPGDEVLIPAPYWVSYPDMAILASGTPKFVSAGPEVNFKLQPNDLRAALTTKTKWLVLNSPSNPTGSAYSAIELQRLGEVLKDFPNVMIMTDDMYEHLVYDGFEYATIAQVCPDLKDRTLTCNGVSKAFAMTGWRIGYAGGPAPLIKAMGKVQSQSTSNPSSVSQAATVAALTGDPSFLSDRNKVFKGRRDMVVDRLNNMPGISCTKPEGAFYVYPSLEGLIGKKTPAGQSIDSDSSFASYLLDAAQVAVVPGVAFGLEPHFRISYATSTEALTDAMNRIEKAVKDLA